MLLNVGGLGGTLHWAAAAINQSYHPSPIPHPPIPIPIPITIHAGASSRQSANLPQGTSNNVAPTSLQMLSAPCRGGHRDSLCTRSCAGSSKWMRHGHHRQAEQPQEAHTLAPRASQPGHSLSITSQRPAGGESTLIGVRSHAHAGQSEPRARDDREVLCAAGPMASRVPPAPSPQQSQSSLPSKVCAENEILPDVAHPIQANIPFFSFCLSLICPALPYPALPCVLLPSSPLAFPLSANV